MKKALSLILYYIFILAAGSLFGIFIYQQYFNSVHLVAGQSLPLFTKNTFVYAFFETLPVLFLLAGLIMQLYKARHPDSGLPSSIAYILIGCLTWFVLFPAAIVGKEKVFERFKINAEQTAEMPLTGGYFRKFGSKIYYFIGDEKDGSAEAIVIDTAARPEDFGQEESFDVSEKSEMRSFAEPFRDPIIKAALPDMPYKVMHLFRVLKNQAESAWHNGIISWLCFCSLGFALFSIAGLVRVSTWHLINLFMAVFMESVMLYCNVIYFTSRFEALRSIPASLGGFFVKVTEICAEPILAAFNIAAGMVFICIGIVSAAVSHKRAVK